MTKFLFTLYVEDLRRECLKGTSFVVLGYNAFICNALISPCIIEHIIVVKVLDS